MESNAAPKGNLDSTSMPPSRSSWSSRVSVLINLIVDWNVHMELQADPEDVLGANQGSLFCTCYIGPRMTTRSSTYAGI